MKSAKQGKHPWAEHWTSQQFVGLNETNGKGDPKNNSGTAAIPLIAGIVAQESTTEEVT